MTLPLILLVENNFNFIRAADAFLNSRNVAHPFARDYKTASALLEPAGNFRRYNGVIIDCFFPYETGSNDISHGKMAIEKMLATDERGQYIERFVQEMDKYVDLTHPGLLKAVRSYACHDRYSGIENLNPIGEIFNSLEIVNTRLGRDEATLRLNQLLTVTFPWYSENDPKVKDYFGALREAMQKDPNNQPLGILVAEECHKRKLPFVLTTSKNRYDELTQPIQNYCQRQGWTLIDCPPGLQGEKTSTAFWEGAYDVLLREIGGRK